MSENVSARFCNSFFQSSSGLLRLLNQPSITGFSNFATIGAIVRATSAAILLVLFALLGRSAIYRPVPDGVHQTIDDSRSSFVIDISPVA
jgi:hypothetical protein